MSEPRAISVVLHDEESKAKALIEAGITLPIEAFLQEFELHLLEILRFPLMRTMVRLAKAEAEKMELVK